jgi:hypothetical protein
MKTIGTLLLALLVNGISHGAVAAAQADKNENKPCVDLVASPASEEDTEAFKEILAALHVDMDILLYVSRDSMMRNYGGAMSFRCEVGNHEMYETDENWTIYDSDLIQGDAARDFVFAHEIAHHMNGDTTSVRPRSKELELRADYNGAKYLLQMGWNQARLLHALDLLNLPQNPPTGYPTLEERRAAIKDAAAPPRPAPPTDLRASIFFDPSANMPLFNMLVNLQFNGPIRLLQAGSDDKFVCAVGTQDPKIPSTRHFAFFDSCARAERTSFDLEPRGPNLGYWIRQSEEPCPEYAANCLYVLESTGDQLQFWNQDLAADRYGWEKELGERELFTFEAVDPSQGLVRIKARKGDYITIDPKTAKLQNGGSEKQAAAFRVLFEPK